MHNHSSASISVIVPVYNGQKFIKDALKSIKSQTISPLEIIVIDDGSVDASAEIVKSIEGVTYLYQENKGAAAARNNGIKKAKGKYLAFLDHDDIWYPNKLELQLNCMNKNPELDAIYCLIENSNFNVKSSSFQDAEHAITGYTPVSMLIKKTSMLKIGLFNTDSKVESFEWALRAHEAGLQNEVLQKKLVKRRIHSSNKGKTGNRDEYIREYFKALKHSLDRRSEQGT